MENTVAAVKTGRGFNASHKDAGVIVHAVQPLSPNACGDWFTPALCGTEPGIRGNGWSKTNYQVNCPKCLKKMEKNITFQKTPANAGLPIGWYKRDGLPVWYCKDFDVLFEITNAHESAPGAWFISLAGMKFKQMDLLPEAREYTMQKDMIAIFTAAYHHIREYFGFMMSSVSFNIENLQKFKNEREQ